jgi:Xaa-Pro dipeptidase
MNLLENQPNISAYVKRQESLTKLLSSNNLDCLVLNPGPSLVYLTGLHFHLSERPVVVYISPGLVPAIVLPELELEKLKNLPYKIQAFPYGEDPAQWGKAFYDAALAMKIAHKIGTEPRQLRLLEYQLLSEAVPNANFISAEDIVSKLRMYKDENELSLMRKAVDIAQKALTKSLPIMKIGLTEREFASELSLQLLRAGCDPELPFAPIVSSGPNSANPHATPSDRKFSAGDLLVIDWGASYLGYFSDITRTFSIGTIDPEFVKISKIVLEANEAGRVAASPGITAEKVDQAARSVIETYGYGKYFTHRTGHGLGMEAHEAPYIRSGNLETLSPGMTFTVEPGIYLPGKNGVRIEDDVVITAGSAESLTNFPRDVRQLI